MEGPGTEGCLFECVMQRGRRTATSPSSVELKSSLPTTSPSLIKITGERGWGIGGLAVGLAGRMRGAGHRRWQVPGRGALWLAAAGQHPEEPAT